MSENEHPLLFRGEMVRAILREVDPKTQTRRLLNPQPEPLPSKPGAWWWPSNAVQSMVEMSALQDKEPIWEGLIHDVNPYGGPGDRLWVKETWQEIPDDGGTIVYRATDPDWETTEEWTWRPSIFMPRAASRIDLELLRVRVERLAEISVADAIAEGIEPLRINGRKQGAWWDYSESTSDPADGAFTSPIESYRTLWNSIHLKPQAVYRKVGTRRMLVAYECHPWSEEDFAAAWPHQWRAKSWQGRPLRVVANPWVWVLDFKRVKPGNAKPRRKP